jgi:K+-transporting ATPase c subunit
MAAYYPIPRVARGRPYDVKKNTEDRFLGVIGEPVVSVLRLNLALKDVKKVQREQK